MRSVVPVRLSDAERGQIAGAAERLEQSLSGFVRQAALEASARVERKVSVRAAEPPEPELPVIDAEPERVHYVDGEPVRRGRGDPNAVPADAEPAQCERTKRRVSSLVVA